MAGTPCTETLDAQADAFLIDAPSSADNEPPDSSWLRCRRLWQSVLLQAIHDAEKGDSTIHGTADEREKTKREARRFLFSDAPTYRKHFALVCDLADMDPDATRHRLRAKLAPFIEADRASDEAASLIEDEKFKAEKRDGPQVRRGPYKPRKKGYARSLELAKAKGPEALAALRESYRKKIEAYRLKSKLAEQAQNQVPAEPEQKAA